MHNVVSVESYGFSKKKKKKKTNKNMTNLPATSARVAFRRSFLHKMKSEKKFTITIPPFVR